MKQEKTGNQRIVALVGVLIMFILLFVDLVTKAWAFHEADGVNDTILSEYFLNLVRIHYIENDGIAFSWFGGNEVAMIIFTILTGVMLIAIAAVYFTIFKRNTPVRITLAVIEAGAVGNLIDRLVLGYVRDFIDLQRIGFKLGNWDFNFGIANVADFFVVLGAVALVFILVFIGEDALIPLKKSWREAAKKKAEEKDKSMPKEG